MVLIAVFTLTACAGIKSPANVKKGLEDAGYTVASIDTGENVTLTAIKGMSVGNIAYYSKDKDERKAAKDAGDKTASLVTLAGKTITVKEKGNWVYYGDGAFIKAIEKIL